MLRYLLQKKSAPLSTLVSRWRTLADDPMRPHIREITDVVDKALTHPRINIDNARINAAAEDLANKTYPGSDRFSTESRKAFKQMTNDDWMRSVQNSRAWDGFGNQGGVLVSTKLPALRSDALKGRLQNLRFGDALSEARKLMRNSDADYRGLTALTGMHELFEYGTRKHQGTRKEFFSHMGPRVLTAESNMLARLTPDELFNLKAVQDAKGTFLGLRSLRPGIDGAIQRGIKNVSEKKVMEDAVRSVTGGRLNYTFGETHLPKAVRKRVENYLISQYGGPLG